MIVIDLIKIFADAELFALNKVFYKGNDISVSSSIYISKESVQIVLDSILDVFDKLGIEAEVRWIEPQNKIFYSKGGAVD